MVSPRLACFLLALGLMSSCKTTRQDSLSSSVPSNDEVKQAAIDAKTTEEFRNIFYTVGKDRYSGDELQKIFFTPPPSLFKPIESNKDPLEILRRLQANYDTQSTETVYEYSRSRPVEIQNDGFQALKGKPITFVVIPGIFTELTETYTFHEIVSNAKSSLSVQYQQKLSSAGHDSAKTDASFEMASMSQKSKPLSDLVKAGSFDDENGNPLINVVYLNAPRFSGESFGPIANNAEVYLRRVNKYFELMGVPENLYILGQSRGAMVVLELITQAEKQKLPWLAHLKGMVSLVGILYGTPLADAAVDPKDPLNKVLGRIAQLSRELEDAKDSESTVKRLAKATKNAARWAAAGVDVTAAATKLPAYDGLKEESIKSDIPAIDPNIQLIMDIAFKEFNFADLRLDNHFLKVRKFKWLMERAVAGLHGLTTKDRVEWWQHHTVPTDIKYYAIGALLPSVTVKGKTSPLLNLKTSYDPRALDYHLLRWNYYDMFRYTGTQLNDGQAVLERSRFEPALNQALNPSQDPIESYYLGVANVDHWGIGFPVGFPNQTGAKSPFPRDILAKSLAIFLARHP